MQVAIASDIVILFLFSCLHHLATVIKCWVIKKKKKIYNKIKKIKRLQVTSLAEAQVSESASASLQPDPIDYFSSQRDLHMFQYKSLSLGVLSICMYVCMYICMYSILFIHVFIYKLVSSSSYECIYLFITFYLSFSIWSFYLFTSHLDFFIYFIKNVSIQIFLIRCKWCGYLCSLVNFCCVSSSNQIK